MWNSEIHWGILKFCLNIYLKIHLLSNLLDDDSSKNQGLILQGSTQASSDPEREKLIKPCFVKELDLRSMGHPTVIRLCCWAESGLQRSTLQRIQPLLRSLNSKQRIHFQQFRGSSLVPFLRMKTIIQAMRTLPPLALSAEPARCATGCPGKHAHREFPGEWGWWQGYLSCHRKIHTGTPSPGTCAQITAKGRWGTVPGLKIHS